MQANSRAVQSNQQGVHRRLPEVVARHLAHPSRRPVADHSRRAFEALLPALEDGRPLVLDSFCGTGHSTAALALRHPGHTVIGVDKSRARLERHPAEGERDYHLLQADCGDIWALLAGRGLRLAHHYLLYPNPWPKSRHLQRRVHGDASLAMLLALGGRIELRSNWQLYVEEFGLAMALAGRPGWVAELPDETPLTLFERKYRDSGHRLWRYRCDGNNPPAP